MTGIPLRIQPLFILMAALIGWLSSHNIQLTLIWMVIIFVSVLIHELGHALIAKFFGQHVMITLTAWGGVTRRSGHKVSRLQDFIIVLAGPIFGFVLGLAAYFLSKKLNVSGLFSYTLQITYLANFFWTIVNLLPIHPLDGGRLLGITLDGLFGFKGVQATYFLSIIFCLLAGAFFFSRGNMIGGVIFFLLCAENFRNFTMSLKMSEHDQDGTLWQEMRQSEDLLQKGNLEEAAKRFKNVAEKSEKGIIHQNALLSLSETLKRQGKMQEAYELLLSEQNKLDMNALKQFQEISFLTGHYQTAIDTGLKIYGEEPDFKTALLNSLSFGEMKQGQEALSWLKSALTYNISLKSLMSENYFQTLLNLPEVQDFLSRNEEARH